MQELTTIDIGSQKARVASTISFPYSDISDAIAVTEGLLRGGGMSLTRDQLAAAMNLSPAGGGFATKVATAKLFGAVESLAGKYQLTTIGHELADPGRRQAAMVDAFLQVPLYKRFYDEFRGKRLPPRPHGLEAAFINFGVSPKNAKAARLAFDKSARAAGFFPNGDEERLVMPFAIDLTKPTLEERAQPVEQDAAEQPTAIAQVTAAPVAGLHRSILGMLDELPAPKANWSKEEQADWLQALATMFQVIYKSDDRGEISVTYTAA